MASLTEACCTPAPPAQNTALGRVETLGGLPTYVTGSSSASAAVIFSCDIFGYEGPLTRKLADKIAAAGYLVVVPDFLKGDPFVLREDGHRAAQHWLPNHPPDETVPELKTVVAELKTKGITSFGLIGFCYGAMLAFLIGKEPSIFKCIVQAHPSRCKESDFQEIKSPVAILAAPSDGIDKFAPILAARKDIESFVKIFPGVPHGWTCRYDETKPEEVKNAEEAHKDMIDWLTKMLPTKSAVLEERNSDLPGLCRT